LLTLSALQKKPKIPGNFVRFISKAVTPQSADHIKDPADKKHFEKINFLFQFSLDKRLAP
jgi:hypothetical protein